MKKGLIKFMKIASQVMVAKRVYDNYLREQRMNILEDKVDALESYKEEVTRV